ncbi:4'-phosphopantetheinyl transferase family protein [Nonomuraea sp. NPDC049400]|uniref:4'-phosphopantetheinyl transferase family protein n=1 Tax=Nonomuraea sp. NPDC049400 TaxID=3364352 RepID=UPI0037BDCF53
MPMKLLDDDECHIWWADAQEFPAEALRADLSATEIIRASRYRSPAARRQFVTACWLLRTMAARQLGLAPAEVQLDRRCPDCGRPHGKPQILGTRRPLHASVSHSGGRVAVALCPAVPIGVDVEAVRDVPVAEAALAAAELAALRSLPMREHRAGFARAWVRKEAALKATGHGLRIPPDKVIVSVAEEPAELLDWPLDLPSRSVRLHTLAPGYGYIGAIALLDESRSVRVSESDATRLCSSYAEEFTVAA